MNCVSPYASSPPTSYTRHPSARHAIWFRKLIYHAVICFIFEVVLSLSSISIGRRIRYAADCWAAIDCWTALIFSSFSRKKQSKLDLIQVVSLPWFRYFTLFVKWHSPNRLPIYWYVNKRVFLNSSVYYCVILVKFDVFVMLIVINYLTYKYT